MDLKELEKINSHLEIRNIGDPSFVPYGKLISGYDFTAMNGFMENHTQVPGEGNIYRASVPELEQFGVKEQLEKGFYGEMPVQVGYCNGKNSHLNGLEYHIGSEINVAITDLVLMLGRLQDIKDGRYDSGNVKSFFVPRRTALQLYETTLHFSPCRTNDQGFKCIVVLPRGTNEPLENNRGQYGDKLLFARNKWLLAHPERAVLIEKGAFPGITGKNLEVKLS